MINFKEIYNTDDTFILLSEETLQYPAVNGAEGFSYKLAIVASGDPEDDEVSVRLQAAICPEYWNKTAFVEDLLIPNGLEDISPDDITQENAVYCMILKNAPMLIFEDMMVENGGGEWMSIPQIAKAVKVLKLKASHIGEDEFSDMLSHYVPSGFYSRADILNHILTGESILAYSDGVDYD